VGHPEWLTDKRFAKATGRAVNARELIGLLDEIFATKTLPEWAEIFATEPELFWSPVNSIDDVVADEQFHAAKAVVQVPDDQSSMPMLATPVDFDGEPPIPRFRAPHVGEHTREILAELDLDAAAVEALVADGVAVDGGAAAN
jgi:crotonobetainyl-CoA:carnitine CoA-transferase CaiB-like acyl-CoA transferase